MEEQMLLDLVAKARAGEGNARETLLKIHRDQVAKTASMVCKRTLDWNNDDELSIALLAFDEAIDSYSPDKGSGFISYARVVIRHRLIDHFRKEARHRHLPLERPDDQWEATPEEIRGSLQQYEEERTAQEYAEEMERYLGKLALYGISLEDLVQASPKHRDTKETLVRVARALAGQESLVKQMIKHKQLPVKDLTLLTGVSRKVVETGRKYIIAVALILLNKDFDHLRGFIQFGAEERV